MAGTANFASLGPTLLARKGGAKPAMRPQLGVLPTPPAPETESQLEDLGWNDMGEEAHLSHQSTQEQQTAQEQRAGTANPVVHQQQDKIARKMGATPVSASARDEANQTVAKTKTTTKSRQRRSALARGKRAAFTLRLDADRHLKLRLACTIRNCSAQQLVTEALDSLLSDMNELESLAAQVTRK